jgi:hypothetical protein
MALRSVAFIGATFSIQTKAALPITCPVLSCDASTEDMAKGLCFQHDGGVPTKEMHGRLCYDSETATSTTKPTFCPFSATDFSYMWVDENIQNQEGKNLDMHGKVY